MRILQVCNFSSGISGVWTRVLEDSLRFIKEGHDVYVFSSDETELGTLVEKKEEELSGIKIKRFPVRRKKGYALWFDFKEEAIKLHPNIIICHGLRKPYLKPAVKAARASGAKCFLVTHAPFVDKELRSKELNWAIRLYDYFLGAGVMNSFDKVISICKWEREVLVDLGCKEDKIVYIPNSLSEEFFTTPSFEEEKKIMFMGRMHPVKMIEVLIEAFNKSDLNDYKLEIVSSKEGEYYNFLLNKSSTFPSKSESIIFSEPVYDLQEKIKKIDSCSIFVLPSKKESLPFGIIEAMARGKIVVATKTKGSQEIITNTKDGFLFEIGDVNGLVYILNSLKSWTLEERNKIQMAAKKRAEEFIIDNAMNKWRELFK